jgi:hypothetical protein
VSELHRGTLKPVVASHSIFRLVAPSLEAEDFSISQSYWPASPQIAKLAGLETNTADRNGFI